MQKKDDFYDCAVDKKDEIWLSWQLIQCIKSIILHFAWLIFIAKSYEFTMWSLLSQRVSPLKFSAAELVFSLECLLHAKSYFICRRAKSCYAWGNKMFTPLYTFAKASLYNFVCTAQLLSVSQQLQRNASETLGKIYISVRAKKKFCTFNAI